MSDETYNGWSNYQTWCWKLWIDNDSGWYFGVQGAAEEIIEDVKDSGVDYEWQSPRDCATHRLASYLEDECDQLQEGMDLPVTGVFADLLNSAVGRISFYEIAENILSDFEIEEEDEEEEYVA